jgi:hypothetical protein
MFATLLDRVDLAGAVVTADALHAERAHAKYLVTQRGAHYLITVKGKRVNEGAQAPARRMTRAAPGMCRPGGQRPGDGGGRTHFDAG